MSHNQLVSDITKAIKVSKVDLQLHIEQVLFPALLESMSIIIAQAIDQRLSATEASKPSRQRAESDDQAKVVDLFLQGYRREEISKQLSIDYKKVKTMLYTARVRGVFSYASVSGGANKGQLIRVLPSGVVEKIRFAYMSEMFTVKSILSQYGISDGTLQRITAGIDGKWKSDEQEDSPTVKES